MKKPKKNRGILELKSRYGYLFTMHWIIGIVIFFALPLIQSIIFSFSEIEDTYTQDTSIVSVIRSMENKSILYTRVTADTNRYPGVGTLRIEKYGIDTAALMFDCIEDGVPTKYFSVVTSDNIETIFGGVS